MFPSKNRSNGPARPVPRPARWIGVALALSLASADARAGFTLFSGIDQGNNSPPTAPSVSLAARNSFVGALGQLGIEDFEAKPTGAFPASWNFVGSGVTAAATATDTTNTQVGTGTPNGTFATSGTHYLYDNGNGPFDARLTFSGSVRGFGFFATDLSDGVPDELQLTLTLSDESTQTFTTNFGTNNNNANVLFFGVVSGPGSLAIAGVELKNLLPTSGDAFGIDDVTVGVLAVPEPSSLILMGLGGLAVAIRADRRRARAAVRMSGPTSSAPG